MTCLTAALLCLAALNLIVTAVVAEKFGIVAVIPFWIVAFVIGWNLAESF